MPLQHDMADPPLKRQDCLFLCPLDLGGLSDLKTADAWVSSGRTGAVSELGPGPTPTTESQTKGMVVVLSTII